MAVDIDVLNAFPLPLDQLRRRYAALAIFDQLFSYGSLLRDTYREDTEENAFQSTADHWCWISEPMLEVEFIALPGERPLLWSRSASMGCRYIPLSTLPSYVQDLHTFEQIGEDAWVTFAYYWENGQWNYIEGIDKDNEFYDNDGVLLARLEAVFEPLFTSQLNTQEPNKWISNVCDALFSWGLLVMSQHNLETVDLLTHLIYSIEEKQSVSLSEIDNLLARLSELSKSPEVMQHLDDDDREDIAYQLKSYSQDEVKAVAQRFNLVINE